MNSSELMELMLKRRSVRKYTGKEIPEETYEKILKAGLTAPTSKNKRPWEFLIVRDREKLEKLSVAKAQFGTFIAGADAAVVILGNTDESDVWEVDGALAGMNMMLMAEALGVGCCWVMLGKGRLNAEGVDSDIVIRELFGIPENYGVLCALSFGVPAKESHPHTEEGLHTEKIHREMF